MTPESKGRLIRTYRVACTAADLARAAVDAALTPAALDALRAWPPAQQREAADHLRRLLDTQREADRDCADLAVQPHQADGRIRSFDTWANQDTPAWRWLLTTIEQESPQRAML